VARGAGKGPESVHLCEYPVADEGLIDERLSADMEALLRLVSLGSAARNEARIKVRQPLAELRVKAGNDEEKRAVDRFSDQIADELNLKRVSLHQPTTDDPSSGWLLQHEVKPNPNSIRLKVGEHTPEVLKKIEVGDFTMQAARPGAPPFALVTIDGVNYALDAEDFLIWRAPEGWIGLDDRGTQLMLDVRITAQLKREGMARDIVRQVQDLRKKAGLEMEDRIILSLQTQSPELARAIEEHREYICRETLATQFTTQPLGEGAHRTSVKVDGQPLTIELRKVSV
jgi:isoleucyl-tRNA synthetase